MSQRRQLQSGCFVQDQSGLELAAHGSVLWAQVIGRNDEARRLSLFYLQANQGQSPDINHGDSEAVLYLQSGRCRVLICGREFEAETGTGLYVRAGEAYCFLNQSGATAHWLISVCPRAESLDFNSTQTPAFDDRFPDRAVSGAAQQMQATEDRFYKLLVGPSIGSESVTQFIGRIPPSKAPEHFHLYEEAICILSGHGRMWAGEQSTNIRPGSIIFLPRKQPHCLECLDDAGMELMGVFYPAGSPAINYKT